MTPKERRKTISSGWKQETGENSRDLQEDMDVVIHAKLYGKRHKVPQETSEPPPKTLEIK